MAAEVVAWAAAMEAAATAATVAAATEVALAAHGGGGAGGGDRGGGEDVDLHEQDTQRRVSRLEVICCESDGAHAVQCQTGKELDMRVRWEAEPCVCMAVVGTAARAHCRPTAFATAVRRGGPLVRTSPPRLTQRTDGKGARHACGCDGNMSRACAWPWLAPRRARALLHGGCVASSMMRLLLRCIRLGLYLSRRRSARDAPRPYVLQTCIA